MYDPSIGRWLEEDPIGFNAGDTNLDRCVGNNPINQIDPTGTIAVAGIEAGVIRGVDTRKHVKIGVGGGVGHRSAPASAGTYWDNPIYDDGGARKGYGYFSRIRVTGDSNASNVCNTPFQFFDNYYDRHGGSISLHLSDLSSGDYDVTVRIKVSITEKLRTPKLPTFTVSRGDDGRNPKKQLWVPDWKLKGDSLTFVPGEANYYYASAETEMTVRMHLESGFFSDTSDTILLIPSFSFTGPEDSFMEVSSSIFVLEIKRVD